MPAIFLLRFQERCIEDNAVGVRCGTKTATRIRQEQSDNDAVAGSPSVLPSSGYHDQDEYHLGDGRVGSGPPRWVHAGHIGAARERM